MLRNTNLDILPSVMKKDIHPQVYTDCTITCACGNSFVTTSTSQTVKVDICSSCHPFYTGQQKFVDTEGRIEKFERKLKETAAAKKKFEESKKAKAQKKKAKKEHKSPSLRDLLTEARKKD